MTTFQTHMRIVSVLAEAWPELSAGRLSIRGWLHNPAAYRPLILQHDPGYSELSHIWIGSMLGLLASAVGSPSLTESRSRRVWPFLDEFPQLPPIKQFPTFLELRRSKGIAAVIGAQDTAQTRRAKQDMKLDGLLQTWQAEAKAMGFALSRDHQLSAAARSERSRVTPAAVKVSSPSPRTASAPVTRLPPFNKPPPKSDIN